MNGEKNYTDKATFFRKLFALTQFGHYIWVLSCANSSPSNDKYHN